MNNEENIYHHGILGQRWGVRRYQNPDGSLTEAGRRKAQKLKKEFNTLTGKKLKGKIQSDRQNKINTLMTKKNRDLTDVDLAYKLKRLQDEQKVRNLEYDLGDKKKNTFMSTVMNSVIKPAAIDAGRMVMQKVFEKSFEKALGVNFKETKKVVDETRKEINKATNDAKKDIRKYAEEAKKEKEAKKEAPNININLNTTISKSNVNDGKKIFKGILDSSPKVREATILGEVDKKPLLDYKK